MRKRLGAVLILFAALLQPATSQALLTPAQLACANAIMLRSKNYVNSVQNRMRLTVNSNLQAIDRFCGVGRRCGGFGALCVSSATCGGAGCYPNMLNGGGVSRYICQYQNTFRNLVSAFCTPADLAALNFASPLCPTTLTVDDLVDCILENNASDRPDAVIVDTTFEPLRRGVTQIEAPHPPGFATYPNEICGVPGSYLLDFGSESPNAQVIGREGWFRPTQTTGCVGDVCTTMGDSATAFAGNLWEAPVQSYAGVIPVCLVPQMADVGNGTFETGSIDLLTGEQYSTQVINITVLIGSNCPECDPVTLTCDSGVLAGAACRGCAGETLSCPPTIVGTPPVISIPLALSTESSTLSVPANNPGGGVTNPSGTFCGACDLDDSFGCQNDADCVAQSACNAGFGNGCCVFGTNTGYEPLSCQVPTQLGIDGARGPFIPHLAGLGCIGKTGSALVDATAGFPGPFRYVEPRLNVYAW